jgi:hypothetical protein
LVHILKQARLEVDDFLKLLSVTKKEKKPDQHALSADAAPLRFAAQGKREPLGGRRRHGLQPATTTSVPEPKLATGSVKIRFDRNEFAGLSETWGRTFRSSSG